MKKKLLNFLLVLLLLGTQAFAQTRTVTGTVTGKDDGKPLPGVSVVVQGTRVGTQTGPDGTFSIKVSPGQVVVFSFLGFTTYSVTPGDGRLNVSLAGSASALNEVIVTGYGGPTTKRDNVGSLSSVKGKDLSQQPVQNFQQSLGGRAAGVQVTIPSGVVNAPPVFRIRGTNSINLSSQPLIIVDGVSSISGDVSPTNSTGNALGNINSEDIESVEILKDAAATAIYGSRAANGVIVVTTKKGKKGKTLVSFDSWIGSAKAIRLPKVLDAFQYTDIKNEALRNAGLYNTGAATSTAPTRFYSLFNDANGSPINTNWNDYVYRTGVTTNNTVSMSGANDNTSYYMSANYSKQKGILQGNEYGRRSLLANVDHRASKYVTLGGKINYSNERNYASASTGSVSGGAYGTEGLGRIVLVLPPNISPYNNDGSYNLNGSAIGTQGNTNIGVTYPNILPILDLNRSNNEVQHIASNVYFQVKPLSWITLKTLYGIDYIFSDGDIFNNPIQGNGNPTGSATGIYTKYKNYTWTNTAQFAHTFGIKNNVSLLVGNEQVRNTTEGFGLARSVLSDPAFNVLQAGFTTNAASNLQITENYLVSFFGQLSYDFDKKYFLSATIRKDGYSAFGPSKKYGYFPGGGLKWDVAREGFWSAIKADKIFSSFQLRGSYGKVGNNAGLGNFAPISFYSSGVYNTNPTLAPSQTGNSQLAWETSKKLDLGVNFGLFNDKITAEVAYYKNDITGLIFNVPQAPSAGLPSNPLLNVGSMYNKGLEVTLNADAVRTPDFTWTPSFNISFNTNKVTGLAPGLTRLLGTTSDLETTNITEVGQSLSNLYIVRTHGVDPATGRRIFVNGAGRDVYFDFYGANRWTYADGSVAPAISQASDAVNYKQSQVKGFGGLTNTFRYKDFDLNFLLTFQFGGNLYYGTGSGLLDQRFWNNTVDVLNRWTAPGQITNIPAVKYNDNISNGSTMPLDIHVYSSNFIKLKSANLGYTLPKSLTTKVGISNIRFYVSGYNLLLFTKYPGPDPEVSSNGTANASQGVDRNTAGNQRTLTAGLSVKF
ncbi:SusC/RagA family TonB-linked outer membrane protein [Mucilaginibacter glaciei]|uniref:SusC/RagA family TonB-linked outer membrane protein n=1 Tax=Mucilaginibacter glaciei TaxID=2772109 RepID=A0A926NP17_9SPHI|nr:SusC/RagA family TonB-linked outer membrane protein [Mucilaginibacter glaciei]MBD1393286.1 SusC/RagA family TonB-linked outer membrane protein [Mucilaginibacter glaciei]